MKAIKLKKLFIICLLIFSYYEIKCDQNDPDGPQLLINFDEITQDGLLDVKENNTIVKRKDKKWYNGNLLSLLKNKKDNKIRTNKIDNIVEKTLSLENSVTEINKNHLEVKKTPKRNKFKLNKLFPWTKKNNNIENKVIDGSNIKNLNKVNSLDKSVKLEKIQNLEKIIENGEEEVLAVKKFSNNKSKFNLFGWLKNKKTRYKKKSINLSNSLNEPHSVLNNSNKIIKKPIQDFKTSQKVDSFLGTNSYEIKKWLDKKIDVDYKNSSYLEVFSRAPLDDIRYSIKDNIDKKRLLTEEYKNISRKELLRKISIFWGFDMSFLYDSKGRPYALKVVDRNN